VAGELKFGLYGLHRGGSANPDVMVRRARLAEEVGFESLWVGDHVAVPPVTASGEFDPSPLPRLEAVTAIAYLAAVTTRVRLGLGVIVLPQRQPVLLAKQLSTLDVLSNGRIVVGVGVGYIEPELRALGASLADRGARAEEGLAAMRSLWDAPVPSFAGRFVSFAGVVQRPLPVQRPHPPIVVGGSSPAAYRRAVRTGDGWYGWDLDLDQTAEALGGLSAAASQVERPAELGELEITITPAGTLDLGTVRRYADVGVDRLNVQSAPLDDAGMDELITTVGETLIGRA